MRDDAIGLSEFTEPMRVLITECASEGSGQGAEGFVCSAKPLEHGLEIAERDVDQFEAGEPEADGACAGDPRVDDLADGQDVDLAADGCSAGGGSSSGSRCSSASGPQLVHRRVVGRASHLAVGQDDPRGQRTTSDHGEEEEHHRDRWISE